MDAYQMPLSWSADLAAVYPKRSGPSGWRSQKLFLALRRALRTDTWETIIEGTKRYAKYCQESGIEGSIYVKTPLSFIEDGSYAEEYGYQEKQDPRIADAERRKAERWDRAMHEGGRLSVQRYPTDSIEAYETRIRQAQASGGYRPSANAPSTELSTRIASLTARLKA